VAYLLDAVNGVTTANLTPADVTGVWAGLRPLLAPPDEGKHLSERTADLSRRHTVQVSGPGVVTITGGKLTTYRKMAEDTMKAVTKELGLRSSRCVTKHLRLHGAPGKGALVTLAGVDTETAARLHSRYGTDAPNVVALASGRPELLETAIEGLPYLNAELLYAVRHEMAQTLDDVLARRSRALIQRAVATTEAASAVATLVGPELGWSEADEQDEVATFQARATGDLGRAGLAVGALAPSDDHA